MCRNFNLFNRTLILAGKITVCYRALHAGSLAPKQVQWATRSPQTIFCAASLLRLICQNLKQSPKHYHGYITVDENRTQVDRSLSYLLRWKFLHLNIELNRLLGVDIVICTKCKICTRTARANFTI